MVCVLRMYVLCCSCYFAIAFGLFCFVWFGLVVTSVTDGPTDVLHNPQSRRQPQSWFFPAAGPFAGVALAEDFVLLP